MLALPVDDVLPEILAHHAAGRNVVVQALPGAGNGRSNSGGSAQKSV